MSFCVAFKLYSIAILKYDEDVNDVACEIDEKKKSKKSIVNCCIFIDSSIICKLEKMSKRANERSVFFCISTNNQIFVILLYIINEMSK